jgi:hypothetical protein
MSYAAADREHDVDAASLERARALLERRRPLVAGSPQTRYLGKTRRLKAAAVRRCSGDLAGLDPPIPYFPVHVYGILSIIRDADDDDIIGFAVEACGVGGESVRDENGRTLRRFFNSTSKRLSSGLFVAVRDKKISRAVLVDGHLCTPIAAAALFPEHNVYGFGGRSWLGRAAPPETEILVIEDRAPEDPDDE